MSNAQELVDGILAKSGLVGEKPQPVVENPRLLIEKLVGMRKLNGLTIEEMATRMGENAAYVVKIESLEDQESLTLRQFRMYVEALGLKAVVRIERKL